MNNYSALANNHVGSGVVFLKGYESLEFLNHSISESNITAREAFNNNRYMMESTLTSQNNSKSELNSVNKKILDVIDKRLNRSGVTEKEISHAYGLMNEIVHEEERVSISNTKFNKELTDKYLGTEIVLGIGSILVSSIVGIGVPVAVACLSGYLNNSGSDITNGMV